MFYGSSGSSIEIFLCIVFKLDQLRYLFVVFQVDPLRRGTSSTATSTLTARRELPGIFSAAENPGMLGPTIPDRSIPRLFPQKTYTLKSECKKLLELKPELQRHITYFFMPKVL